MSPGVAIPRSYNGYAQVLVRTITPLLKTVRPRLQQWVQRVAGERSTVQGCVFVIADGSRFESPRTVSNETELRCAGKTRSAPQVFQTTLLHSGTNAVWDFRCGPRTASERQHMEEMLADLPPRSLITADAGFSVFELYRRLNTAGVKFLLRVGRNVTLKTLRKRKGLDIRGDKVWVWPEKWVSQPPGPVAADPAGSHQGTACVPGHQPARSAGAERGGRRGDLSPAVGIEVTYRTIKQTLNRATWLSRTARTVLAEHQATILGFWMLQLQSLRELGRAQHDLRR
jgi:hypothetical protein